MNHSHTNCRNEEGITVGLIDSMIATARVLMTRDLKSKEVEQALLDFSSDEDIQNLFLEGFKAKMSTPTSQFDMMNFVRTEDGQTSLDAFINNVLK